VGPVLMTTDRAPESSETVHGSRTLVLTYHAVFATDERRAKQPAADRWYSLTAKQFEAQMEYLSRQGYTASLLQEFLAGQSPARSVVLTFDDGHESNLTVALPILQQFGFRADFFVTVANIGRPGFMNWRQLGLLLDAGMSVQSHGLHHRDLTGIREDMLADELRTAKDRLECNLARPVKYFAIPGGFADRGVYLAAREAGYEAICNSEPGLARTGEVIARVGVMHSTSQTAFQGLVQRRFFRLLQRRAQRKFGKIGKTLLGVRRYEALKRLRLSSSRSGGDV
jgi:peptidoglycan/xylan/chitin deacetylase (PgdA/CDA1 family)